jgi:hypothetical protein
MSLLTYEEVQQYAPLIKFRVENRIMPPWHINTTVGIQDFKNDRGLTREERETIVQWVDAGAPRGDESATPPTPEFREGEYWRLADRLGEPDRVIESEAYDLPAETQDKWFRPVTPTGITEERWVKAIEIRPANEKSRQVVHHVLATLHQDEGEHVIGVPEAARDQVQDAGLFMEWAVGKAGQIFQPDAGKLMLPDSRIEWELHLHAIGERVPNAAVEMGVWFHDTRPEYRTILGFFDARGPESLDIPPGEIAVTQDHHVLPAPARLEGYQPHMHMRGKAMSMEAIRPDGRKVLLCRVDPFRHDRHTAYWFPEDAMPILPAGTRLVFTAWHDNRLENPDNPDPEQWVGFGRRTVDEMAHAWVAFTRLSPEQYDELGRDREPDKIDEVQPEGGNCRPPIEYGVVPEE